MNDLKYIIDTSRNGVTSERQDCANWCNINNSGLGRLPTTDVSDLGVSSLDALVWIKTPGESDGTSDTSSKSFDGFCGSQDSYQPMPDSGDWADDFYVMLVKNANPAIKPGPGPTPPGPTPPSPGCPGGSLSACIGLCPSDATAFQACVSTCQKRCTSNEFAFL